MKSINLKQIILRPVVTEKSLADQSNGKYYFWVEKNANKNQIAEAFKSIFGIDPLSVNTIKVKGKVKTNWKTRQPIMKSDRKKAIIIVPKDKKIELLNIKTDKK